MNGSKKIVTCSGRSPYFFRFICSAIKIRSDNPREQIKIYNALRCEVSTIYHHRTKWFLVSLGSQQRHQQVRLILTLILEKQMKTRIKRARDFPEITTAKIYDLVRL